METLEDHLLAAACGDEQAFAAAYDATASRLFGMVVRVLGDHHLAEEVTQEVFLELWRTGARFDPERGSAISWMLAIAHRRAVDRVRSTEAARRRDRAEADLAARNTPRDETALAAHAALEATRVREALRGLSAGQRHAIELAYFGGHTHTEIARLLQVPLGTAKGRIRDGLIRLRDLLDRPFVTA